jgi:hypothetical protein
MLSAALFISSLVAGVAWVAVVSFFVNTIGRRINIDDSIPAELREPQGGGTFVLALFTECLFFVVMPTMIFSMLNVLVPLTPIRTGLGAGLFAFAIGTLPTLSTLTMKVRFPLSWTMFFALGQLIKVAGALTIIGFLFSL